MQQESNQNKNSATQLFFGNLTEPTFYYLITNLMPDSGTVNSGIVVKVYSRILEVSLLDPLGKVTLSHSLVNGVTSAKNLDDPQLINQILSCAIEDIRIAMKENRAFVVIANNESTLLDKLDQISNSSKKQNPQSTDQHQSLTRLHGLLEKHEIVGSDAILSHSSEEESCSLAEIIESIAAN